MDHRFRALQDKKKNGFRHSCHRFLGDGFQQKSKQLPVHKPVNNPFPYSFITKPKGGTFTKKQP